jgi:nucleotide-binding universal stress UspA family protein
MLTTDAHPTLRLKKILYATDFSDVARKAGTYAGAIARRFASTVAIVNVLPLIEGELEDDEFSEKWQKAKHHLIDQQNAFRDAGVDTYFMQSNQFPVHDALHLIELRCAPDLIVTGTESKSSLDRFLLGSTAEYLIRNSSAPVLTIGPHAKPLEDESRVFESIVLATDFTETSKFARDTALALMRDGAHVFVCHAPAAKAEANPEVDAEETAFWTAANEISGAGKCERYTPSGMHHAGKAAEAIVQAAREVHAGLIVMGARARSFWLSHLHRGVTQDVLAEAPCPVMTIR